MNEFVVPRREIVARCVSGACPDCGEPLPSGTPWSFPAQCRACGMTLRRHDGFFLGALVLNYGFFVFGALPPAVFAWKLDWLPPKIILGLVILAGLALPVLLYRISWRLWLALHYGCLPAQLPANGAKAGNTDD